MGNGIPSSQSNNPRPNPMTFSLGLFVCRLFNAPRGREFQRCDLIHCGIDCRSTDVEKRRRQVP